MKKQRPFEGHCEVRAVSPSEPSPKRICPVMSGRPETIVEMQAGDHLPPELWSGDGRLASAGDLKTVRLALVIHLGNTYAFSVYVFTFFGFYFEHPDPSEYIVFITILAYL